MKIAAMRTVIATGMLAISTWSAPILADDDGRREDANRHEPRFNIPGTWLVEVTPRDCISGSPLGTFLAMNSFVVTGTLLEYGTTPMITPAHRTPGFGDWQRIGARRFRAVFSLFHLPDAVNVGSLHRIERVITMTDPDRFTADSNVKIFDPSGEVLAARACATETARRIS